MAKQCMKIIFTIIQLGFFSIYSFAHEDIHMHFEFNSFKLSDSEKKVIKNFKNKNIHCKKIEVKGYTDERGGDNYNLILGYERANFVNELLIKYGIQHELITKISYGKNNPECTKKDAEKDLDECCTEETEDCWKIKRRVDVVCKD